MLTFGDGSVDGEVSFEMLESMVGVVLTELKEAGTEIEAARTAEKAESVGCV